MPLRDLRRNFKRFFAYLNSWERAILAFTVYCFIRPLTLPNYLSFGWIQIESTYIEESTFLNIEYNLGGNQNLSSLYGIELGGKYINSSSEHRHEVAIVIPYRNRSEHLIRFLAHIHSFLVKQNRINYQIFVIEQDDAFPFNRGNLLNIGFIEVLRLNPSIECFIFHDVDIVPLDLRQFYECSSLPRHLCSYIDKFRYVLIYPNLFGGVISIRSDQFRLTNGYSNLYSGWGGEDDDFYTRVKQHFPYIERFGSDVGRCKMFAHQHYEPNPSRSSLLKNAYERASSDGLTSLNGTYHVESVDLRSLYVNIRVKLMSK